MTDFFLVLPTNKLFKNTIAFLALVLFSINSLTSQTITFKAANEVIIDSNKSCPGNNQEGPLAIYLPYEFCNTTGSPTAPLDATFSITGSGYSLAGDQPATQNLGILAVGECRTLYWFITYPCAPEGQTASVTVELNDDIGTTIATSNESLVNEKGNSASATGILGTQSVSSANGLGQVTFIDVVYEFGNTPDGNDINFQPVGNVDFDADCFQLVGVEILQSAFPCIPVGSHDQMFFIIDPGCGQSGSGNEVEARFYFQINCVGGNSGAQPYAYGISGNVLKYSGNYDSTAGSAIPPSGTTINSLSISKSVTPQSAFAGPVTLTYTVAVENTSSTAASISSIDDILPGTFTYNAIAGTSNITTTNSTSLPTNGDSGSLTFIGGSSSVIYPYSEFIIPANSIFNLIYTVDVPAGVLVGDYVNSATFTTGMFTSFPATATFSILEPCNLTDAGLTNIICNDNGTGSDSSDDTFTFQLNPTGVGLDTTYSVSGGVTQTNVSYGLATNFGPFPISGGDLTITITDDADGACQIVNLGVITPATCSVPTPITANNDNGIVTEGIGGTAITNVLDNDDLGGSTPTLATVNLTQVSTTNAGVTLDPATGAINVTTAVLAGTYVVEYQICEATDTANCTTAFATVTVLPDTDGDGIDDETDLDDDNDGILDTDEGLCALGDLTTNWTENTAGVSYSATAGTTTINLDFTFAGNSGFDISGGTYVDGTYNTAAFWSEPLTGATSFQGRWNWDTAFDGIYDDIDLPSDDKGIGTMTITFSQPVENPVINFDRIGGWAQDTASDPVLSNSAYFTLTTAGASLTRLSGTDDFEVTATTIQKTPDITVLGNSESTQGVNDGTAAGSVKIYGTYTTLTFDYTGVGVEGNGRDEIEVILSGICPSVDTDGDGTPDYLDTDSDNDGCPDAIEAAGTFTTSDLTTSDNLADADEGQVDANGVPEDISANSQQQATTVAVIDELDSSACGADLSLTKTIDNATPKIGETITYTITLTNSGPLETTGVQVMDMLPAGLLYVGSSTIPAGTIYNEVTGIWDLS